MKVSYKMNYWILRQSLVTFIPMCFLGINNGWSQSGTDSTPRFSETVAVQAPPERGQAEAARDQTPDRNTASSEGQGSDQVCEKLSHCAEDEIRPANVCILGSGPGWAACGGRIPSGYLDLQYEVNDEGMDGILRALDNVANRCAKINRLTFVTRGNGGHTDIGLNHTNVESLRPYSCLMDDAHVFFGRADSRRRHHGWPIGADCSGHFFTHQLARNLFSSHTDNNTGRVWRANNGNGSATGVSGHSAPLRSLSRECKEDIDQKIRDIRERQFELSDNKGTECPILTQCRRTPYNDILTEARSLAGQLSPDSNERLFQQVVGKYDQLLGIEDRLRYCNRQTPHTGCSMTDFEKMPTSSRGVTISNQVSPGRPAAGQGN